MVVFAKALALLVLALVGASAYEHSLAESVQFAADFYKTVRQGRENQNVIVSPLSVRSALGQLLMGARGKTANELVRGLYLPTYERSEIASYFQELSDRYDGETMKIANKIFTRTGYTLRPEFNDVIRKSFKSEVQSLDFADSENAADVINSWVNEKTNGKISKLFDANAFDDETALVVANAVYFKGTWKYEFRKGSTRKDQFWLNDKDSVQVDMMSTTLRVKNGYIHDLDATVVMIPYSKSDLSMMIVLPSSTNGLSDLEKKMQTYDFSKVDSQLFTSKFDFLFPKFEIESSVQLPDVLQQMGMGTMFTDNADFSNLFDVNRSVSLDSGIHKAYIKVNEEGTEAAASSGFGGHHNLPSMDFTPEIRVDHPFFFAIVSPYDVSFVGSLRRP